MGLWLFFSKGHWDDPGLVKDAQASWFEMALKWAHEDEDGLCFSHTHNEALFLPPWTFIHWFYSGKWIQCFKVSRFRQKPRRMKAITDISYSVDIFRLYLYFMVILKECVLACPDSVRLTATNYYQRELQSEMCKYTADLWDF